MITAGHTEYAHIQHVLYGNPGNHGQGQLTFNVLMTSLGAFCL